MVDTRDRNALARNWQKDSSVEQVAAKRTPRAPLANAVETQAVIDRVALETLSRDHQQEKMGKMEKRIPPNQVGAHVDGPLRVRQTRFDSVSRRGIAALEASTSTKHDEGEMLWQTLVDDSLTMW
jgi:hypothetical protein